MSVSTWVRSVCGSRRDESSAVPGEAETVLGVKRRNSDFTASYSATSETESTVAGREE
ncbi:hypothetical protein PPTG_22937, partial [Phytophthora nicotianae INRA-310]